MHINTIIQDTVTIQYMQSLATVQSVSVCLCAYNYLPIGLQETFIDISSVQPSIASGMLGRST